MADKVSLATLALAKAYTDEHGGGGGGTSNYNDLTHKPTVNGVEFKGTMTGESLGLVDAEDGKGLSANDYTDADKAIVGGVTSALAGKVDKVSGKGLSTNDYSNADKSVVDGVTTALNGKVDKVSGKGLSTNDYSDADKTIVDGVTSALGNKADASTVNAILNGQSLDSFGDVETALAGKMPSYNLDKNIGIYYDAETGTASLVTITTSNITQGSEDIPTSGAVYTASQNKVDKVTGKGLSTNDYTDADKAKVDGAFPRSEQAVLGAKNLLENKIENGTRGTISITVNEDKSITLGAGTSASTASAPVINSNVFLKKGTYIVSSNVANGDFFMRVTVDGTNTPIYDKEITLTLDADKTVEVRLYLVENKTLSSALTFYPMIRLASDPDDTYVPYAMTNQQITPYVQAITNPNLLDNPWFTVNQRGFTTDTTATKLYTVDRWYINNSKATFSNGIMEIELGAGGGSVRPRFAQVTEHSIKVGQRYTLTFIAKISVESGYNAPSIALIKSDGSYDGSKYGLLNLHDTGNNYETFSYSFAPTEDIDNLGVTIIAPITTAVKQSTVSIKAVKLELGSVSTLAMDTAPNYATELLKCQRYFVRYKASSTNISVITGFAIVNGTARFSFNLPVDMMAYPTISYSALADWGASNTNATGALVPTSIARQGALSNRVIIIDLINTGITVSTPYILYALSADAYIDFSADL